MKTCQCNLDGSTHKAGQCQDPAAYKVTRATGERIYVCYNCTFPDDKDRRKLPRKRGA